MNYLYKSIIQTLSQIKTHPRLFIILFFIQFIFLVTFSLFTLHYQFKVLKNIQEIVQPLQTANYDPALLEEGKPFLSDLSTLRQGYTSIKKNLTTFFFSLSFLYITINAGIWTLSHYLFHKKKNFLTQWFNFIVTSFLLIIPFLILSYFILKKKFISGADVTSFSSTAKLLLYGFLIFYYLLLVSYAFLDKTPWKEFVQKIYTLSILKIHKTLPALALISAFLIFNLYLLSTALNTQQPFFVVLMLLFLFVFLLTFSKIFWIAALQEIDHETDSS